MEAVLFGLVGSDGGRFCLCCSPWGATVSSDSFSMVFPLGRFGLFGVGFLEMCNGAVVRSRAAGFQGRFGGRVFLFGLVGSDVGYSCFLFVFRGL